MSDVVAYTADASYFCSSCEDEAKESAHPDEVGVVFSGDDWTDSMDSCGTECQSCGATWHPCRGEWDKPGPTVSSVVAEAVTDFFDYVMPDQVDQHVIDRYFDEHEFDVSALPKDDLFELAEHGRQMFGEATGGGVKDRVDFLAAYAAASSAKARVQEALAEHDWDISQHHGPHLHDKPMLDVVVIDRAHLGEPVKIGDLGGETWFWKKYLLDIGDGKYKPVWKHIEEDDLMIELTVEERLDLSQLNMEFDDAEDAGQDPAA